MVMQGDSEINGIKGQKTPVSITYVPFKYFFPAIKNIKY